jgi:hypothetical protein
MLAPSGTIRAVRADPNLSPYVRVLFEFQDYIRRTAELKFVAHGEERGEDGYTDVTRTLDYAHRFTPTYQRGMIASFYQLEAWMKDNPRHVALLTLTTYQSGQHSIEKKGHAVSIPESFDLLKGGWDNLSKVLRKHIPGLDYILAMEAHKSGYPHMHVFLLTPEPIPQALQDKCALLWERKYKAGSASNGVDFTFGTSKKPIGSIRNYLMKYVCKSFYAHTSKFPDTDPRNEMTAGRHVFNALAWKYHWRLIQKSNRLSAVMKYQKPADGVDYYAVEISRPVAGSQAGANLNDYVTVWAKAGTTYERVLPIDEGWWDSDSFTRQNRSPLPPAQGAITSGSP